MVPRGRRLAVVPAPDDVMRFQTALSPADTAWLLALVADWQMIADNACLIIDTRNALKNIQGPQDHIVKA